MIKGGGTSGVTNLLVSEINKRLPVSGGPWALHGMEHGLLVWEYCQGDIGSVDGTMHACCTTVLASMQDVLRTLKDHSLRSQWDSTIKSAHTIATGSRMSQAANIQQSDIVAIVPKVWSHFSILRDSDAAVTLARSWQHHSEDEWAWMLWQNLQDPVTEDAVWSYVVVSPLEETDRSALVYVACSPSSQPSPATAAARLAGIHQYLECQLIARQFPKVSKPTPLKKENQLSTLPPSASSSTDESLSDQKTMVVKDSGDTDSEEVYPSLTEEQQQHIEVLNEAFDSLLASGLGGVEDGWTPVGTNKGVTIMKKAGEGSVNCVKGTGIIRASAKLILEWVEDHEKVKKWDSMFSEGRVVERVTSTVRVEQLMYKAVWPTSGRDFCVVAGRQLRDDGTWIAATRSVVHPGCPQVSSYVRATVIDGGFVLRPVPETPDTFEVTYVTKIDLKGNIPSIVVNKVTQNAPMCVATLRDLVQEVYANYQADERRRQLQAKAAALAEEKSEKSDKEEGEELDNGEVEQESDHAVKPVLSNQSIEYPMVDPAHVDYRTLGNQAAAGLLAELLLASDIDIYQPKADEVIGGWKFDGIEKNVVILKKQLSANEHYFMGKGIIPLPVRKVWAAVHEPRTRFAYDPMLKEMRTIEDIGDRVLVMYMLLQAQQCLLRQARDFCFLHTERIEQNKHIVAAQSVEHPKCPEVSGIQRGMIHASGWCVEPVTQDGAEHSMVTYLGRVELGGNVPQRLSMFICRKQTLAIASLSKHLVSLHSS